MFTIPNFAPAAPEMFVLGMACVVLLVDIFSAKEKQGQWAYILTQVTLIGAMLLTLRLASYSTVVTFNDTFLLDPLATVLKIFIYITAFVALLYSRAYVAEREIPNGEYYVLCLFSILGMMVLVSAGNFLTLYLGLELLSLPLYALVALQRDSALGSEAAMKYFVMGAMASGMLLYGLSMIYGASKSLDINQIATYVASKPMQQDMVFVFALVFVVAGIAFKLGAVPFHMWAPDVYDGSPTSVTLFIGSAPKIAVLGMAIRLLVGTLPSLHIQWEQLLIIVALLSMVLGNFVAIMQKNIKRMLAYSSIAHMGYMLLGVLSGIAAGYAAATFYIITYALMSMGAFGMIVLLSRAGFEAENIEDFRGLNARNPWLALMMLILMFSMAGIPPTVGFFAKLGVLEALISVHLVWLAALALLFAVVGAYYYIRVVKVMYFDEPEKIEPVTTTKDMQLAISVNCLAVLALGLFPSGLINLCRVAFAS